MTDTWRLEASYAKLVRLPSGSTVAISLLPASKTLVTALPRGFILATARLAASNTVVCGISQRVDGRHSPTCRIEYRRGDKPERVRGRDRPARSVESKAGPVPERIHAGHNATAHYHILLY